MSTDIFYLAFSCAPFVGPKRFARLLEVCADPQKAWFADLATFRKAGMGERSFLKFRKFQEAFDIPLYQKRLAKAGVFFISQNDPLYPKSFYELPNPPIGLFGRGDKTLLSYKSLIAVVGTRRMTSYGEDIIDRIVLELVDAGFGVVSGMALGIDSAAHKATIESRGPTIAVLGCGVDCPYPRENEPLYRLILERGGLVLSEYPLGARPTRGTFPARNRIIAALCRAVLVPEAGEDSGALITASIARELKKPIFAVPGPVTSQASRGALGLLKQGALLVESAQDILSFFGEDTKKAKKTKKLDLEKFSAEERKILAALGEEPKTAEEIVHLTKIPLPKIMTLLSLLQIQGVVGEERGEFRIVG